jgi:hypothetical protein
VYGTSHQVRFLPKFHPELNPIERYWAALKRYLRTNCQYTLANLRSFMRSAMRNCVKGDTISKFFMYSHRFEDVYCVLDAENNNLGTQLQVADQNKYAVARWFTKRYKSHRGIPSEVVCDELIQLAIQAIKQ